MLRYSLLTLSALVLANASLEANEAFLAKIGAGVVTIGVGGALLTPPAICAYSTYKYYQAKAKCKDLKKDQPIDYQTALTVAKADKKYYGRISSISSIVTGIEVIGACIAGGMLRMAILLNPFN